MPPGLTCIWQAVGDHRIPFEQWMRMDLDYIDRWSLKLDLRILLLGEVLHGGVPYSHVRWILAQQCRERLCSDGPSTAPRLKPFDRN